MIAPVGQVCWQAVWISPAATARPSPLASRRADWMRCTQNVHFSITPWPRTVTSGLSPRPIGSGQRSIW